MSTCASPSRSPSCCLLLTRDNATGLLKGDGLVTYLKEESVPIAILKYDGAPLRFGDKNLSVTPAKFEMKGGEYQAKSKAGKGKNSRKKQLEKLEKKLGWGGFDDKAPDEKVGGGRGRGLAACTAGWLGDNGLW
jgi:HIV Tat-specific factor 1